MEILAKMQKKTDLPTWQNFSNRGNARFYDVFPLKDFQETGERGGLAEGCDIELLKDYLQHSDSILELGAGYGRVLEAVIHHGYRGKLYAIERNANLHRLLCEKFNDQAVVFHGDIQDFKFTQKFDLILWMWTGITEFSKNEQTAIIKNLYTLLNDSGHLVIDTMPLSIPALNETNQSDQKYRVASSNGVDEYSYWPSEAEIKQYASLAQFQKVQCIDYKTTVGRERILNIFSK